METTTVDWDYIGIMENKMETTTVYWGYIGKMENKKGTTTVDWDYIGIVENKMETTKVYWGCSRCTDLRLARVCFHKGAALATLSAGCMSRMSHHEHNLSATVGTTQTYLSAASA